MKIGYLGPKATFTEAAAALRFSVAAAGAVRHDSRLH